MRIGLARTDITPQEPVWMAGYGDRDRKSEGAYAPLYAGAVYLEGTHDRALILTADHVGYSPPSDATVRAAVADATGLLPRQIVLTATHTHCGPQFSPWNMPGDIETGYLELLQQHLTGISRQAIAGARDGSIQFSRTTSTFGINRRLDDGTGTIAMAPNPEGSIDRDLDTLWFYAGDELLGSLTIYGCHPTSLAGYLLGPDYPGFVCKHVEADTGAPALFATGCAGDVRPWFRQDEGPDMFLRPDLELLEQTSMAIAGEVLGSRGDAIAVDADELRIDHVVHRLPYDVSPSRDELETELNSDNPLWVRWATERLAELDAGGFADACPHEVQLLQFNPQMRALFLGGEVLSEIGLHIKRVLQPATTMTVAYSNGLIAYVPSQNAWPLGGYEVTGSHRYFRRPAPFTADCERLIVEQTRALVDRLA